MRSWFNSGSSAADDASYHGRRNAERAGDKAEYYADRAGHKAEHYSVCKHCQLKLCRLVALQFRWFAVNLAVSAPSVKDQQGCFVVMFAIGPQPFA